MASVQPKLLFSGKLNPESSAMVPWKNPPKHVVSFWIRPPELVEPFIFTGKKSLEITKVVSMMDQANHYRIEVTIKNHSTVEADYSLYGYYLD